MTGTVFPVQAQKPMVDAAAVQLPDVGRFVYTRRDDTLWWSDTVFTILGYRPGAVEPSLARLLQHCHPDDVGEAEAVIARTLDTGENCMCAQRYRTVDGAERNVVIVGSATVDSDGSVGTVEGYLVDVTEGTERTIKARMDSTLTSIVGSRAVIEQAKGMLMMGLGISAEAAFDLLAWRSQMHNVKVRDLAQRIVTGLTSTDLPPDVRDAIGSVLMDAHGSAADAGRRE